ncbi:MAG: type II toxin-antitoxin system RelE/ParE family toxin [Chitinispirillales bacterium]|jgi:putative addiction module killer protein|nr:type II toxin-antitoxin system RelE/ParE family toxin [Chitinispirillales bacterium]
MTFQVARHDKFAKWLNRLRKKDRVLLAKAVKRLYQIEMGNFGDHGSVGGYVSELRIDYGPGYRLYYTLIDTCAVFLLCAGDKSTQARDIKLAQKLAKEARNGK